MRIKLLLLFFMLSVTFMVQAQDDDDEEAGTEEVSKEEACSVGCENGWCWGADKTKASEQWTLLDDNVGMKNFKGAEAPLEWLLANTPCLNKALYINGEKVFKALEKEAKTDSIETIYQDKLVDLLYSRMKYFGQEKFIKNKIGALMYSFYVNRGGNTYAGKRPHWTKMFNFYDDVLKLNGKESAYYNVRYFMLSADKMFKLDKDTTAFIEAYDRCEDILEYAVPKATEKTKAKWDETANAVEVTFVNGPVKIDCNFVKKKWIPLLKKDANDMKLAKKSIRFMINDKCTDDPDFDFLVELVYDKEPSAAMAKLLAQKYLGKDDYVKAEQFYREMIKMAGGEGSEDGTSEEDPAMQAEGYMAIAGIKAKQNKYNDARSLFLKAAATDANQASKAYTSIGDLYVRTARSCLPPAEKTDPVANQAPYLAAYDMYAKAGNNAKMSSARGAFPSKTDIFTWQAKRGYVEGQSITVYGWIGGSAILRAR